MYGDQFPLRGVLYCKDKAGQSQGNSHPRATMCFVIVESV